MLTCLLFRYRKYVLIVSDTLPQAVEFLADIKRELEENEDIVNLFGVKQFVVDNRDTLIVKLQTENDDKPYEFRVSVRGSEQSMRGTKWRHTRPDLVIGDDLENDELVENEERRAKFRAWIMRVLLPAGSKRTCFRIVGTILHFDSFLQRVMPEELNKKTPENLVVTPLKTYSKKRVGRWLSCKYRAHDPEYTHILWPEMFSRERLEGERQAYIEQGEPEGYYREYLNDPIAQENAMFDKKNLIPYQDDTQGPWEFTMVGDLAISDKDKRAFTVLGIIGTNHEGKTRVFDIKRFRGDTLQIIDTMFELDQIYRVEQLLLEAENIARTLGPILSKEMERRNQYFLVEPVPCNKDKRSRARPMQARVRQHMVEFDHDAPWWPELQQELLQFPSGAFKDQVDALAHYYLHIDNITYAPTENELMEEEYEDEVQQFMVDMDGRSAVTGY